MTFDPQRYHRHDHFPFVEEQLRLLGGTLERYSSELDRLGMFWGFDVKGELGRVQARGQGGEEAFDAGGLVGCEVAGGRLKNEGLLLLDLRGLEVPFYRL